MADPRSRARSHRRPPKESFLGETIDVEATVEELRDALEGLRVEIRSRFPRSAVRRSDEVVDWESLYSAVRRRLGTFGMSERSGEVDEFGMDEVVLRRARPLLDLLYDHYFRVELHGIDHLPDTGPCLLVANRSGLLPYDGLMISHAVERHHPLHERPRFAVADWLVTLPFVQPYLARLGGVRSCRENAQRLLESKCFAVVFPEGVKGAAKVFRDRYQLQRFGRGGVVRLAIEMGVPLVPVGVVGGEEVHPILFKSTTAARLFGLPFLPITPTFPLMGPLGALPLPSKWVIRLGEPVALDYLDAEASSDELLIARLNENVRTDIQVLIDRGLRDRESVWS
ncbi:MAG: 1-acyl-sn-glycerol-3-phosphate acyltransferase [Myxococcales bacterium]|nr:1-acyl-sn-glycerol-3-phosphate acyltransferase [Myxococcales bacterium]